MTATPCDQEAEDLPCRIMSQEPSTPSSRIRKCAVCECVIAGCGPPEANWDYSILSADERAYVDHNRDTTGWSGISATYGAAAAQTAQQAMAQAAASQLGLENANIGVVP